MAGAAVEAEGGAATGVAAVAVGAAGAGAAGLGWVGSLADSGVGSGAALWPGIGGSLGGPATAAAITSETQTITTLHSSSWPRRRPTVGD